MTRIFTGPGPVFCQQPKIILYSLAEKAEAEKTGLGDGDGETGSARSRGGVEVDRLGEER